MCVALGGKPDKEVKANQKIIDDYEKDSKNIQEMLQNAKTLVVKRFNMIHKKGLNCKERVVNDELINK